MVSLERTTYSKNQNEIEEEQKKITIDLQSQYQHKRNMKKLFTLCLRKKTQTFIAREIRQNFLTTNEFLNELVKRTQEKTELTFNSSDMTILNPNPKKFAFNTLFRAVFKHNDKYYCFALPSSSKQAFLTNTQKLSKYHVYGKKVDNGGAILGDVSGIKFESLDPKRNKRVYWNAQEFFNSEKSNKKFKVKKKLNLHFMLRVAKQFFKSIILSFKILKRMQRNSKM